MKPQTGAGVWGVGDSFFYYLYIMMQAYIIRPINITLWGTLKSPESELLLCALLYFSTETQSFTVYKLYSSAVLSSQCILASN